MEKKIKSYRSPYGISYHGEKLNRNNILDYIKECGKTFKKEALKDTKKDTKYIFLPDKKLKSKKR